MIFFLHDLKFQNMKNITLESHYEDKPPKQKSETLFTLNWIPTMNNKFKKLMSWKTYLNKFHEWTYEQDHASKMH
jgi:hypothetical protein